MYSNYTNSQLGLQLHRMRYAMLECENRLSKVMQILYNSEVLINNLIDKCNRLARSYQKEKNLQRQKIISNLKREVKEYILINIGYEEKKKDTMVNLEIYRWKVYYNKRSIKSILHMNLKDDKKYGSNKEIVKISNRFRPLSAKDYSKEVSNKDLSDEVIIRKLKVIEKTKEKKKREH